jgi:hypothetical protein
LTASDDADFVSGFCEVRLFINGEWKLVVGGFVALKPGLRFSRWQGIE